MKPVILIILCTVVFGLNAQTKKEKVTEIRKLSDSLNVQVAKEYPEKSKKIRTSNLSFTQKLLSEKEREVFDKRIDSIGVYNSTTTPSRSQVLESLRDAIYRYNIDSLIRLLGLRDVNLPPSEIEYLVEKVQHYKVVYEVYERFKSEIALLQSDVIKTDEYINGYINNLEIIRKQMNLLLQQQFVLYQYTDLSKQALKSINLFHDNDFLLFSKMNQDRDYTGGFRFEFTTDLLKMRLFRPWNKGSVLSYQSIIIGGEGYTPNIRFTIPEVENATGQRLQIDPQTKYFNSDSYNIISNYLNTRQTSTDRPFASFQYIARGKYRLHHHGHVRSRSYFKLGKIGGNIGKDLQAIIHQDLTVGSIKVVNWDKQIAHGGRLAFNIDHHIDLMLISNESTIFSKYKYLDKDFKKKKTDFSLYLPLEVHTGIELDAIGFGIGVSNRDFKSRSGNNDLKINTNQTQKKIKSWYNNTLISTELRYRYVIHNSMLEGVGWFKTWEDDVMDDEAVTLYRLQKNEINRNLLTWDFSIGLRLHRMNIYYLQTRNLNSEFKKMVANKKSPNSADIPYGWGRIGFNFLI